MSTETSVTIYRWSEQELSRSRTLTTTQATVVAFARAYGADRQNEDAVAVVELGPSHHLLLLADGVGGLPGGAQAAKLALDGLSQALQLALMEGHPVQHGILAGFDQANGAIRAQGCGASTLAVVEVADRNLRTYHAGDSGVLVTGQRGRLKLMTIAHSPVGYAQEAGYLTEAEAIVHEERHVVSNLLGSLDMRIEIGQRLLLSQYDTVVVGSDGLFDNLLSEEIAATIRVGTLPGAAAQLSQLALQRMVDPQPAHPSKPDDLSFILYRPRGLPRRKCSKPMASLEAAQPCHTAGQTR